MMESSTGLEEGSNGLGSDDSNGTAILLQECFNMMDADVASLFSRVTGKKEFRSSSPANDGAALGSPLFLDSPAHPAHPLLKQEEKIYVPNFMANNQGSPTHPTKHAQPSGSCEEIYTLDFATGSDDVIVNPFTD
jgi:hypothetical protein